MSKSNYIRFTGHLYPNMEFQFKPGWETERVAHFPHIDEEENKEYRVSLLNKEGTEIVGVNPAVNFEGSCAPNGNKLGYAVVVAYLPMNDHGAEVVFKRGDYVIYRRPIAEKPPQVKITEFKGNDNSVYVQWKAESSSNEPLTYNLVYVVDKKRFFTLAREYTKNSGEFDISIFPGSKSAHVAVLAMDGLRSGFDISKSFPVPERRNDVFILKPGPAEIFNFGQDISFCGRAHDVAGASLPKECLVWKLNGKVIAKGVYTGTINQPESGSYVLGLEAIKDNKTIAFKEIKISVDKMNKNQKRYFELLKEIDSGK